jgi:uncharacterized repeat protein (TIGR02543 family)
MKTWQKKTLAIILVVALAMPSYGLSVYAEGDSNAVTEKPQTIEQGENPESAQGQEAGETDGTQNDPQEDTIEDTKKDTIEEKTENGTEDGALLSLGEEQVKGLTAETFGMTAMAAAIGENSYTSLKEAVKAAKTGDVIKLESTVDLTGTENNIEIPSGTSLTLDLNGQQVKADNDGDIKVYGSLTLKDGSESQEGKITSEADYDKATHGWGVISVYGGGSFTMESGYIYAVRDDADNKGQFGVCVYEKGTATIKGGTIEAGWYALSSNGTNSDVTMNVNGGKLISTTDYAIYAPAIGNSVLTITKGTVDGKSGAVAQRAGTVNIEGGTIASQGISNGIEWSDGTSGLGSAAVNIAEDKKLYGNCVLNITGGDFTNNKAAVSIAAATENPKYTVNVTVTGGVFHEIESVRKYIPEDRIAAQGTDKNYTVGENTQGAAAKVNGVGYATVQEAVNAANTGDTVKVLKNVDITSFITISGKNLTLDLQGNTVKGTGGTTLSTTNTTLTIQNGTIQSEVAAWNSAIAVGAGTKLTIAKDATVIGPYGISMNASGDGNGTTIDVYGAVKGSDYEELMKKGGSVGIGINGNVKQAIDKTNYATITIHKDAVVTGVKGKKGSANSDDGPAVYAAGYAKWIIEDGATLSGSEALSIKSGIFEIQGGTFEATGVFQNPATSYNNGTEATGAAISITNNNNYAKNVEMTISGGIFSSSNGYAFYESDTEKQTGCAFKTGGLSISKGTFRGATGVGAVYSKNMTGFVSGGSFSSAVDETYCAENYHPNQLSDGNYSVHVHDQSKYTDVVTTKAYCDRTGVATRTYSCSVCGEVQATDKNVEVPKDPNSHYSLTETKSNAPTVNEAGNIAYWTCKACGKIFSDKDAKKEIKAADTVRPKLPAETTNAATEVKPEASGSATIKNTTSSSDSVAQSFVSQASQITVKVDSSEINVAAQKSQADQAKVTRLKEESQTALAQAVGYDVVAEEIVLKEVPKLDIQVGTVDNTAGSKVLNLDISMSYATVATINGQSEVVTEGAGQNAVIVETKTVTSTEKPVTIELPLPEGFVEDGTSKETVLVRHTKGSTTYYYKPDVSKLEDNILSFENPHGFSPFAMVQDTRTTSVQYEGSDTVTNYNATDVNITSLPSSSKSGYTFTGWTLKDAGGTVIGTYSGVMTEALLNALNGKTVTATANYKEVPVTTSSSGSSSSHSSSTKTVLVASAATGDPANAWLPLLLILAAVAGICITGEEYFKKKRHTS